MVFVISSEPKANREIYFVCRFLHSASLRDASVEMTVSLFYKANAKCKINAEKICLYSYSASHKFYWQSLQSIKVSQIFVKAGLFV
jgi:hypothetical protein